MSIPGFVGFSWPKSNNIIPKHSNTITKKPLQGKVSSSNHAVRDILPSQEELKKARMESLVKAQDKSRKDRSLAPHGGKTFCNIGVAHTLKDLGIDITDSKVGLAHPETGTPYTANLMARKLATSAKEKDGYWMEVDSKKAQKLANMGLPVIGAQRSKGHGHIVTVRPCGYDNIKAEGDVLLNNIGKKNAVMTENKCFRNPPLYYTPRGT